MEPDYCCNEQEARDKAKNWTPDNKKYPVYFFETDTSGEKSYEEFFTNEDTVNNDLFEALGVIKNTKKIERKDIESILSDFIEMFNNESVDKATIVKLLSKYISDFKHIETGKGLDQKM